MDDFKSYTLEIFKLIYSDPKYERVSTDGKMEEAMYLAEKFLNKFDQLNEDDGE